MDGLQVRGVLNEAGTKDKPYMAADPYDGRHRGGDGCHVLVF